MSENHDSAASLRVIHGFRPLDPKDRNVIGTAINDLNRYRSALERIAEGARTRPGEEGGGPPSDSPRRLKRTR